MKEKWDMWVPLKKKKKKNIIVRNSNRRRRTKRDLEKREKFFNFFLFFFFLRFTEIGSSEFVGPRTKIALRDEGYAWVPKTRDFT